MARKKVTKPKKKAARKAAFKRPARLSELERYKWLALHHEAEAERERQAFAKHKFDQLVASTPALAALLNQVESHGRKRAELMRETGVLLSEVGARRGFDHMNCSINEHTGVVTELPRKKK